MLEILNALRDLNPASILLRLALAMAFGGLIGLERGRKRRPAGFRTYMLVCLGAALTMMLGQYERILLSEYWSGDMKLQTDVSRFGAQVINGIGFLGAGTVIVTGRQEVKGLTTAAGLWACACMGLAIGAGFYECVILAFLLIFLTMRLLPAVEAFMLEKARNMTLYVEFHNMDNVGEILDCIKAQSVQIYEVDLDRGREECSCNPNAIFSLRLPTWKMHTQVLAAISGLDCIYTIDEI